MLFGAPLNGQDPTVDLAVAMDRRGASNHSRQKRGGNATPFGIRGLEFPERDGVPAIVAGINRQRDLPGRSKMNGGRPPRYRPCSRVYGQTFSGWVYTAFVMDLFARTIPGGRLRVLPDLLGDPRAAVRTGAEWVHQSTRASHL